MRFPVICLVLVAAACTVGCGGGGKGLEVSSIHGPDSVDEGFSAQYSVSASGDNGIMYQWAVDPPSAGQIDDGTSATITFNAAEVASETVAEISVVVTSDDGGPEMRSRDITIRTLFNPAPPELQVGEIQGPSEIGEYSAESFSISAAGDSGITFEWTCDPPDIGVFETPDEDVTVFSVVGVDVETEIQISVEVNSENDDPEQRDLLVTVLNSYEPASWLGAGHPMVGINYSRSNRSTHPLPTVLDLEEIMDFPYEENYYTTEGPYSLVVGSDERLYFGTVFTWYVGYYHSEGHLEYRTWAFDFGGDLGERQAGGMTSSLTSEGLFTTDRRHQWQSDHFAGTTTGNGNYSASLMHYGNWPELIASASGGWGWQICDSIYQVWHGETDARRFHHLLPLPDGRLVVSFARDDYGPVAVLLLDQSFNVLAEHDLASAVRGLAFDERTGIIYAACDSGLYCYGWELGERWNTTSTVPMFAFGFPVIADDGGILGIRDGVIRRIEPDGTPGWEVSFGGYMRPAVLNDGTIAAIGDSSIFYFDPATGASSDVPLPSGPNTGEFYTRPPLIDSVDNIALFLGPDLYVIERDGSVVAQRTFEFDIVEIRLGQDHLFIVLSSGALLRISS